MYNKGLFRLLKLCPTTSLVQLRSDLHRRFHLSFSPPSSIKFAELFGWSIWRYSSGWGGFVDFSFFPLWEGKIFFARVLWKLYIDTSLGGCLWNWSGRNGQRENLGIKILVKCTNITGLWQQTILASSCTWIHFPRKAKTSKFNDDKSGWRKFEILECVTNRVWLRAKVKATGHTVEREIKKRVKVFENMVMGEGGKSISEIYLVIYGSTSQKRNRANFPRGKESSWFGSNFWAFEHFTWIRVETISDCNAQEVVLDDTIVTIALTAINIDSRPAVNNTSGLGPWDPVVLFLRHCELSHQHASFMKWNNTVFLMGANSAGKH